jgi:hypothetical protein
MKASKITAIILIFFAACKKDTTTPISEIPAGIIHTDPCPSLYKKIIQLFPYSQDNKTADSIFFGSTIQKRIVLTAETEVYLTFVNENAFTHNTIGWYSYDKSSVPSKSSDINKQIIFPNVSVLGSGGGLSIGDMLQVGKGKFKAGTVIGFFLILDGWQHNAINWNQPVMYTDFLWNSNQNQQHVLYKDTICNKIVLSWEDTPLDQKAPPSDRDFNDNVFAVSDNNQGLETTSFDLTSMLKE